MTPRLPRLTLGQPTIVSQAPAHIKGWGPWQFPAIERLADGRLHISFHVEADSAKAYGLPVAHAVSSDEGQTWQQRAGMPPNGGLLLANGDRLRPVALRSRPVADLSLPPPAGSFKGSYGGVFTFYEPAKLPAELRDGWRFARLPAGKSNWIEETATVHLPGEVRFAAEGVLAFPWMWRMRTAPDGSVWGFYYGYRAPGGTLNAKGSSQLLRSTDVGHTWELQSEVAFQPDPAAGPTWDIWDGFGEPNVGFLPDGSLICLLRTTDGHGIGPLYHCYSSDNGRTWSTPRVFDDRGVWPAIVELQCGVTLASYGRPGLFVRASADPSGRTWGDRVAVVEPLAYQTDTCSYSDMIVLDAQTAMIVYSNFQTPNHEGVPCKAIMVRTISVS